MNFIKKNFDKLLGLMVIAILALFAFRIVLFLTFSPAEEGTIRFWMYDVLGIEAAAGEERPAMHPKQIAWSFDGPTGQYDKASVVRGLQVYRESCSACHGLDKIAFRNLTEIGFSTDAAKAIAAEYIFSKLDEYGDEVDRPGLLTDYFPDPFPNDVAAAASNSGKIPPDLSLITKAREDGPNYVYSILTGYIDPPADFEANSDITSYNPYFAGWEIVMPMPLFEDQVEYADGTEASLEQMSEDVTNFLMWAAEPNLDDRHEMGFKVILYMAILTLLMFISMRVIWRRVKK